MVARGPTAQPSIVGCQLIGGEHTIFFGGRARGRQEGCRISEARKAGLFLLDPSTAPAISDSSFRDCKCGVYVRSDVDADWALGPGVAFANIAQSNLKDWRVPAAAINPGPAAVGIVPAVPLHVEL